MSSLLEGAAFSAEWRTTLPPGLPDSSYSPAYEAFRPVFAGQGRLYGWMAFSSRGSSQYILVFDSQTEPQSGAIPTLPAVPIAATSNAFAYWGSSGRWFTRGCWIANSSTPNSLTPGSADTWFDAQFVPVLSMNADGTITA